MSQNGKLVKMSQINKPVQISPKIDKPVQMSQINNPLYMSQTLNPVKLSPVHKSEIGKAI